MRWHGNITDVTLDDTISLPTWLGDENDELALKQARKMFPDREVVGVQTREIAFGGGNIHCITQQMPRA